LASHSIDAEKRRVALTRAFADVKDQVARDIITRHDINGETLEAIAASYQLPVETIKSKRKAALTTMRCSMTMEKNDGQKNDEQQSASSERTLTWAQLREEALAVRQRRLQQAQEFVRDQVRLLEERESLVADAVSEGVDDLEVRDLPQCVA